MNRRIDPLRHLALPAAIAAAACAAASGQAALAAGPVTLSRPPLSLTVENHAESSSTVWRLVDSRSGRTFTASTAPASEGIVENLAAEAGTTLTFTLRQPDTGRRFRVSATLADPPALRFAIDADETAAPPGTATAASKAFTYLNFPPPFRSDLRDGRLLFCDRSSGTALPQSEIGGFYAGRMLAVYGNSEALDMPWIGAVDPRPEGDGLLTVFDTPADAAVRLEADTTGPAARLWPRVVLVPSRGRLGYTRVVSMHPVAGGGVVGAAKTYRRIADAAGLVKPLAGRLAARPRVDWLRGATFVWGADGLHLGREAWAHGVRRAVVNGHGAFAPDDIRGLTALGLLSGEYDSYTDIRQGPTGRQTDDIESTAYRTEDGEPVKGWRTLEGVQYYTRSSALARRAAEAIIPPLLATHPYTARFLDVSAAIELREDHHPDHPMDRRADMAARRRLHSYIQELGLVAGAEHAKDWVQPLVDYSEGPMSGGFWWNTKVGYLRPPASRAELDPNHLKYGMGAGYRVPLHELVYHDCVVTTWYWGDSNGFLYGVAPELSDAKDAWNVLYGTAPMVWSDHVDYGWNRNRDRLLRTIRSICPWTTAVAFDEMTDWRAEGELAMVQRTRFSSGAAAVASYDPAAPRAVAVDAGPDGEPATTVTLAPYGWFARARGGVVTSRLWVDGAAVAHTRGDGFEWADTLTERQVGSTGGVGSRAIFRVAPDRWNIHLGANATAGATFRLNDVPGFPKDTPMRLALATDDGRTARELPLADHLSNAKVGSKAGGKVGAKRGLDVGPVLKLPAPAPGEGKGPGPGFGALYTIMTGLTGDDVVMVPDGGDLGTTQPVELAVAADAAGGAGAKAGLTVRYTLDGTEPDAGSAVSTGPLALDRTTTVTARAFRGPTPAGTRTARATFRVVRPLYDSGKLTAAEGARAVTIPLEGMRELRLRITDGGDGPDYDTCNLAEPRLIGPGRDDRLTSIAPILAQQNEGKPEVDSPKLAMGGKKYGFGITTHPVASFAWPLEGRYTALRVTLGSDDRTGGRGSVRYIFEGVR